MSQLTKHEARSTRVLSARRYSEMLPTTFQVLCIWAFRLTMVTIVLGLILVACIMVWQATGWMLLAVIAMVGLIIMAGIGAGLDDDF